MSNSGNFEPIYIRELDTHFSLTEDDGENEQRQQSMDRWCHLFQDIELMNDYPMPPFELQWMFGLEPEDWQWALYRAHKELSRGDDSWAQLEPQLVKALLSEGRAYAIRRYARKEGLPAAAAMAAALPYGMTALLYRFFAEEGLPLTPQNRQALRDAFEHENVFEQGTDAPHLLAYDRTALVQAAIHDSAADVWGAVGPQRLNRQRVRKILSLTRLHFAIAESKRKSFPAIENLEQAYAARRRRSATAPPKRMRPGARFIPNWQSRHLWPMTYYYPVGIRQAFERASRFLKQTEHGFSRAVAVNELALAYATLTAARDHRSARCRPLPSWYQGE